MCAVGVAHAISLDPVMDVEQCGRILQDFSAITIHNQTTNAVSSLLYGTLQVVLSCQKLRLQNIVWEMNRHVRGGLLAFQSRAPVCSRTLCDHHIH